MDGSSKDLVFACKDTETRDAWVAIFQQGFDSIRVEAEQMRKHFQLTMNFNKDKLGIRVEEKIIEEPALCLDADQEKKDDEDIPAPAADEDKADADKAEDDIPAPAAEENADAEKAEDAAAEPAAEDGEAAAEPAPAAAEEEPAQAAEAAEEAQEEKEPACTLV